MWEGFETANPLTNFDFSRLYPFSIFTTTDMSILSITSARTKPSTVNVSWLQLFNIAYCIIYSIFGGVLVLNYNRPHIHTDDLCADFGGCTSNVFITYCTIAFLTPSLDAPCWAGVSLTAHWLVFFCSLNPFSYIGCFSLQTVQIWRWLQFLAVWFLGIGIKHS